MISRAAFFLLVLGIAGAGTAADTRGDLYFPHEGWAVVARWHVGASARSAREGWLRGKYSDRGWPVFNAGGGLPASADGSWLRNSFKAIKSKYSDYLVEIGDFPGGTRFFVNAVEIEKVSPGLMFSIARQVVGGMNHLAFYFPSHGRNEVKVPQLSLYGVSRQTGRQKKLAGLKTWRYRPEKLEREIPDSWISSPMPYGWFLKLPMIPTNGDEWLGEGPVCVKTVLDFPHYWGKRRLTAYFHEIPGNPALYINGEKVVDKLESPLKIDIKPYVKLNGRDVMSLVFDAPPAQEAGKTNWGIVAINWDENPVHLSFKPHLRLVYASALTASQPGALQALRYVSQILSMSSTQFEVEWEHIADGDFSSVCADGALVASWSGTPFTLSNIDKSYEEMIRGYELVRGNMSGTLWLVSPPTAGRTLTTAGNSRLAAYGRKIAETVSERNLKLVPLQDVFRSALRKQRRWPVSVEFSDTSGRLSAHGSYLMALVILTAFSLP